MTLLDEYILATADIVALSGGTDKDIRNWQARGVLNAGRLSFTGRREYTLADAIRLATVQDLTSRVLVRPSDAAGAAEMVVRYALEHATRDPAGRPVADPNAYSRSAAFALGVVGGEMQIGLIDTSRPGYSDMSGPWSRAHIVLPITGIIAEVLFRWLARAAEGAR